MEFLRSFLRRHLAGKPVVASPNVGCFIRLSTFLIDDLRTQANCEEIGFFATKPKSIACRHMSLFKYSPINAFRLIYVIICHQKLESIF